MSSEPEQRYTVMLVPPSGKGDIRQWHVSQRRSRRALLAVATTIVLLVLISALHLWSLPLALRSPVVLAENAALRQQVAEADQKLDTLTTLVARLSAYDARLRELEQKGMIAGTGPIPSAEAEARALWLSGQEEEFTGDPDADLEAELDGLETALEGLDTAHLHTALENIQRSQGVLPLIWPVEGVITSVYGWRRFPFTGQWQMHGGVDIGAPMGASIYATNRGLVVFSDWSSGHGQMVVVDHGEGVMTRYCHASALLVETGDEVETGDIVALVGSTGLSTGPHLHYDLLIDGQRVNPLDYLP